MPRKNNDEPKIPDYTDKINFSITITVVGTSLSTMLSSAKELASEVFHAPLHFLHVVSHSDLHVETWRRFEKAKKPDTWSCSVTIGLIPEEHREPLSSAEENVIPFRTKESGV